VQEHNIRTKNSFNATLFNSGVFTVKKSGEIGRRSSISNFITLQIQGWLTPTSQIPAVCTVFTASPMNHISDATAQFSHPSTKSLEAGILCLNHRSESGYVSS